MKAAISLPNDLFSTVDAFAERKKLSRSELCARALREYLERHDEERVTAQLNAVCTIVDTHLAPDVAKTARRLLRRSEW